MKFAALITLLIFVGINLFADGIIVTSQEEYPSYCLKNKVTDIDVEINGLVAETIVYQEFENEWTDSVNGVYSFPLPPDARATRLQYSVGDSLVDAVLKVQQQSTTPGTGEGGIIAEINEYMGSNVLKISLSNIAPWENKAVRLSYISTLKQYHGNYEYNYPLNTGDFIKHPIDFLKIRIKVHSSKSISGYSLISHPDYQIKSEGENFLDLEYIEPKAYLAKDIVFCYTVENSPFEIELFSWKPDSVDGYFTLVGKPQIESADSSLPHKVIFLLGNSTTMIGNKLNQSKTAISLALEELAEKDSFNVLIFNSTVSSWKSAVVPATQVNVTDARNYVEGIDVKSGNRLDLGILASLNQLKDTVTLSSILAFTDGKSPLDLAAIESSNTGKTCISFVAIGNDIDRVRLEAVAAQNYGFVAYINENNILANEMINVFQKIKNPIIKEVSIAFDDPIVYDVFPSKYPPVFAGTDFILSGRYKIPGTATITIEGTAYSGDYLTIFEKDFIHGNELSRKLWAKLAIDDLEAQILIHGENDTLKNNLIKLSLDHNIRCRYTAFIEDYPENNPEEPASVTEKNYQSTTSSRIINNYPNPFLNITILKLMIDEKDGSKSKFIELYDIQGRLLKIIDITHLDKGIHEIILYRNNFGHLTNGFLIARLKIENTIRNTIKMMTIE
jgi:Ca-activated chloride channel family protein